MGLWSVVTGKNAALDVAEAKLVQWEDRLFTALAGEEADLPTHVRADMERFQALNLRMRVDRARSEAKSDRNLMVVGGGLLLIAAKVFGFIDPLLKLVGSF